MLWDKNKRHFEAKYSTSPVFTVFFCSPHIYHLEIVVRVLQVFFNGNFNNIMWQRLQFTLTVLHHIAAKVSFAEEQIVTLGEDYATTYRPR